MTIFLLFFFFLHFHFLVERGYTEPYAFLVGPYAFFSGPITSTRLAGNSFCYGFPRKLRSGPYGPYDNFNFSTSFQSSKFALWVLYSLCRRCVCLVFSNNMPAIKLLKISITFRLLCVPQNS